MTVSAANHVGQTAGWIVGLHVQLSPHRTDILCAPKRKTPNSWRQILTDFQTSLIGTFFTFAVNDYQGYHRTLHMLSHYLAKCSGSRNCHVQETDEKAAYLCSSRCLPVWHHFRTCRWCNDRPDIYDHSLYHQPDARPITSTQTLLSFFSLICNCDYFWNTVCFRSCLFVKEVQ